MHIQDSQWVLHNVRITSNELTTKDFIKVSKSPNFQKFTKLYYLQKAHFQSHVNIQKLTPICQSTHLTPTREAKDTLASKSKQFLYQIFHIGKRKKNSMNEERRKTIPWISVKKRIDGIDFWRARGMAKGVHNSREKECISWILKTGCKNKGGVTEPTLKRWACSL